MPALTACAYCGSAELQTYLSLGAHPPSNSFLTEAEIAGEERFPLDVAICGRCSLSQLTYVVSSERIFDRYLYLSSSSRALRDHYGGLVHELIRRFAVAAGSLVVDIGCNDGVLLEAYPPSLDRVGVEPSQVADIARSRGLDVVRAFFDDGLARELVERHGTAAIVTATNVFAHVERPHDFTAGVRRLIGDSGVFVLEASYLPSVIDELLFDTVYHEHLRYLSLTPLIPFTREHGLKVIDVERVPFGASGPAFRVYLASSAWPGAVRPSVESMLAAERAWGIAGPDRYATFADRVRSHRERLLGMLGEITSAEGPIAGYGAPAKGNTLLNHLGLDRSTVAYLVDTNPLKQGTVAPGSHIPIVPEERLLRDMPAHALLLAWNYVDHFLAHSEYVRRGGRFLVPLPEIAVVPDQAGSRTSSGASR